MAAVRSLMFVLALPAAAALVQPRRLSDACNFTNAPTIPYFWDPSCPQDGTSLGCLADGINPQCRFCGEGAYSEVFCPASWCEFDNPPHIPYYWDSRCSIGSIGCLADGKQVQCRFCGEYPYNGTVHCPDQAHTITPQDSCEFDNEPKTPYFWDATCEDGVVGCKADGKHIGCRFCGAGSYAEVNCPATLCTLEPKFALPSHPYKHYWEPQCWNTSSHILGCLADGIHPQCRYCGGGEYENITCPAWSSA
mmetsp:Transcript_108555/g.291846  ORF Transcript_108555/g.291846 Transcript_108555/m.291846 type:complete len:250 (+) Transcript_108555:101-850(+)